MTLRKTAAIRLALAILVALAATAAGQESPEAKTPPDASRVVAPSAIKVTILSTMLSGDSGRGIGEWGFSALLEVEGKRLLIDTGARPETVLHNAQELGIDLSGVTDVVLTHNHSDHTGGLLTLRRELSKRNSTALSRAHVAPAIFQRRLDSEGKDRNGLLPFRADYIASGGVFVEHPSPVELLPGVWFSGPVPRPNPERNWGAGGNLRLETPAGFVQDTIPEDSSIIINTPQGLVVITGCGHAGIVNILEYARSLFHSAPVHAVVGGLHLYDQSDASLDWTGQKMREYGVADLLGAHCTGIEAVYRLRAAIGLKRQSASVGAVGASFTLAKGIDALGLAH